MSDSADRPKRRIPKPGRLVRLWPRVRPYRGLLLGASVALVLSSMASLAFPMVVRYLLDAAFVSRDRALLDRIALGLVALFSVQAVLNYAQAYLLSAAGEQAVAGLRRELFGRLLEMPPGFFADRRTGELTSRLSVDIGMLQSVLSHQISEFSRQILALVGGVVLLTWLQPRLTLTALLVAPVVVGTALVFGRRLRTMTTGVQDRVAEATGVAEEAFSQIRTVQSFVQEPAERARYAERVRASVLTALKRAKVRGVFFGMLTFSTFAAIVFVLWQGGLLVLDGRLTAGALVSFLLYTITIAASIGALATSFTTYQEAVGAAERVFEILEMTPAIADPAAPVPLPQPVRGKVAFEGVSFRYQADPSLPWTLEDVTLAVAPGEVVALVGPSGGGKTTLVSLLPRFWDVDRGRIAVDGIDIRALKLADLRGAIGIVPQEPALFSGTIRENIAYARPAASDDEVQAAARAAHAHEFIERLPQGYGTLVGERGIKLSGGQRQRVAIARAILKDPAILILDEATSNLDNESERLIEDALEKLLVGRTTLIIAHRLSTVQRADRLLVVDHGRIVEEGTHAELLALGGLYARLYQRQFRDGMAGVTGGAEEESLA
ncbi:MAG TPA: ABC transporter transmembrane domain-containing protein [Gemmatimonadales bacterium]|nr:ABC transporter transmembrane domain-containing protein [Gemmatimonadales bacterium]